jgi:hypothetical protein
MAIVNLQAILNIEDVDKIIELLEHNNWDESVILLMSKHYQAAASAFYA